ncbi:MAG: type II toxin-antitoxin system Phd/YefM family antitoxin [Steroidobacteraceae bacterium]
MEHALKSRRPLAVSRNKRRPPAPESAVAGSPWQLQAAKAKFSEVFRRARADGPQIVTRGGTDAVVVIPVEQYELLLARSSQPKSLVEFFKRSPLAGLDLHIERDRDVGRPIEL